MTFSNAAPIRVFLSDFSCPHIKSIYPTDPVSAFTNCPKDSIESAFAPAVKLEPNNSITHVGFIRNSNKSGAEHSTVIAAARRATAARVDRSPRSYNAANRGASMVLTEARKKLVKADVLAAAQ